MDNQLEAIEELAKYMYASDKLDHEKSKEYPDWIWTDWEGNHDIEKESYRKHASDAIEWFKIKGFFING